MYAFAIFQFTNRFLFFFGTTPHYHIEWRTDEKKAGVGFPTNGRSSTFVGSVSSTFRAHCRFCSMSWGCLAKSGQRQALLLADTKRPRLIGEGVLSSHSGVSSNNSRAAEVHVCGSYARANSSSPQFLLLFHVLVSTLL